MCVNAPKNACALHTTTVTKRERAVLCLRFFVQGNDIITFLGLLILTAFSPVFGKDLTRIITESGHCCLVSVGCGFSPPGVVTFSFCLCLSGDRRYADVVKVLLERGDNEQLLVRNSLGQRAAEISLDISTADVFRQYEGEMSDSDRQSL